MCNVFDVYTKMCKIVPILLPLFGSLWAHGTASGCLNGYNWGAGDAHKRPKSARGSNRADAKSGHCQMERKCENQPISPHGHSAAKSILRGCPQTILPHTSFIVPSVHRSFGPSTHRQIDVPTQRCTDVSMCRHIDGPMCLTSIHRCIDPSVHRLICPYPSVHLCLDLRSTSYDLRSMLYDPCSIYRSVCVSVSVCLRSTI